MATGPGWTRLSRYVTRRRTDMGMRSQRALAEAAGLTERVIWKAERGISVSRSSLAALDAALGWAPGSSEQIIEGGEPSEASRASLDPAYRAILGAEGLTEGEKAAAIAAIEERRSRLGEAGFTGQQQETLRAAPGAYKVLIERQRQREEDEADGKPALRSGDRPA